MYYTCLLQSCTHIALLLLAVILISQTHVTVAQPHSQFSWDFSEELGSVTWWPLWYPTCTLPFQAPIDIEAASVTDATDQSLEIHTTDYGPIRYVDAVVAYNSSYNLVNVDVSVARERFYIYWAKNAGQTDKPLFQLKSLTFRFPSEHLIEGDMSAGELRYTFQSTGGAFPAGDTTVIDDVIDDRTVVSVIVLLHEVADNSGDAKIEALLTQIMAGYPSGTGRVLPYMPNMRRLYNYKGTQTRPPCNGNVQYFVSEDTFPIESSTLKLFLHYGPVWDMYRAVQPLEGRPLRLVRYTPTALEPEFRDAPADVAYSLERRLPEYKGLAVHYAVVLVAAVCIINLLYLLKLLADRLMYAVPYSMTWRVPATQREVFGMYLRYGTETGAPKFYTDGRPGSSSWGSESSDDNSGGGAYDASGVHRKDNTNPLEKKGGGKGDGKGIVIEGYADDAKDFDDDDM